MVPIYADSFVVTRSSNRRPSSKSADTRVRESGTVSHRATGTPRAMTMGISINLTLIPSTRLTIGTWIHLPIDRSIHLMIDKSTPLEGQRCCPRLIRSLHSVVNIMLRSDLSRGQRKVALLEGIFD